MLNRFMQSRLRGLVILALILSILPAFLGNPFHYELAIQMAIIAATVVGLNLLVGFAGQISLGHAGFLASVLTSRALQPGLTAGLHCPRWW